jgi:hypothetical protein
MITYSELYLGLLNYVKAIDPAMPMFVRGTPTPSYEGVDEWISFEILSFMESPSRRHTVDMLVDVQLICYTRHATHRKDNKFTAQFDLMDKYGPLFHQKDVNIKNTCIQFKENRIVPLDLRSVGDYAKDIINQLPPLHTLSTVILNQGLISSYTPQ